LRSDDVTPGNPGIVEDAGKAIEQGFLAAERFPRPGFRFVLFDYVRWNRRRQ
jgi:hypothetical protein